MQSFIKRDHRPGRIAFEVAGLRWLAQAESAGGARIVPVVSSGADFLEEPRLSSVPPSPAAAEKFGRALAHTHAAGASHLGAPPPGVSRCWMGEAPLVSITHAPASPQSWGAYYAEYRLLPHAERAHFSSSERQELDVLFAALAQGRFDHAQPRLVSEAGHGASRTHGDLWSGNVMWTASGAVLIDPAAQGGHGEEDLAALAVFGAPHLHRIWGAYREVSALEDGWEERVALHQLHILMIHAELFGGGYASDVMRIVRSYT